MASTPEQIREVFEQDIAEKTRLVEKIYGKLALYEHGKGMRVFRMWDVDPCRTRYQGEK